MLPNGTYVRKVSNWSSSTSTSSGGSGGYSGGSSGGSSSGAAGRTGGGAGYSYGGDYFESGTLRRQQNSDVDQTDSTDSDWLLLANGTYVRKQSSFTSSSSSSSSGGGTVMSGMGSGSVVAAGQGEHGDEGSNSTGWIRQPDGTLIKKASSWTSWSSSSVGDIDPARLDQIKRQLEDRAQNNIQSMMPGNVEPGFENQYRRRHKRSAR